MELKGIGTGFSSDVLSYDPGEIISCLKTRLKLKTEELASFDIDNWGNELEPHYRGFKGSVTKITPTRYFIKGNYISASERQKIVKL